jgi:hypothetical protein
MSGQKQTPTKKYENEAERKKAYREKLREELGEKEYLKQQAEKKRLQRAKAKTKKTQVVENAVEEVIKKIEPKIIKEIKQESQSKITSFFKPISKSEFEKNIKTEIRTEPVKKIIKEVNKGAQKLKEVEINKEPIENIINNKKVENIAPLYTKYETKTAKKRSFKQYLDKIKRVYKLMFNEPIDPSIINELTKLLEGKTFNEGIINHIQFFRNIKGIINILQKTYTKRNTLSSYINAVTSVLARIPHFKKEYEIIAQINNDLSKSYQRERDFNDAPDATIDKLISFDPVYINSILDKITNINDKALFACYTLIPPQRVQEFQLMRISDIKNLDKLNKNFNYLLMEDDKPSLFNFSRHKTEATFPNKKVNIPVQLANILDEYIESNDMVKNDFLFGNDMKDFKISYAQSTFTDNLKKLFKKYTGKSISVDLLRNSFSTYLDSQNLSLAERKKYATEMGHSLITSLQYSKKIGVERLNNGKSTVEATPPPPIETPNIRKQPTRAVKK